MVYLLYKVDDHMKNIKYILVILLTFFISTNISNAVCDTTEKNKLNSEALKIKTSYEEMTGILDPSEYTPPDGLTDEEINNYVAHYTYFKIYIANLTENLYVVVENNITKEKKTFTYEESENGTVSFDWEELRTLVNYKITVYSSSKTGCPDTKLHTLTLTMPRYNSYSEQSVCKGAEDFYLCYKYLSVDSVDFNKFMELVTKYKEGKIDKSGQEIEEPKKEEKGFSNFFKEHKKEVIVASIIVIILGGTITVIIVKKQRSKKNEQ